MYLYLPTSRTGMVVMRGGAVQCEEGQARAPQEGAQGGQELGTCAATACVAL